MTITFKPGHHPDADQLSAFVEQALPAHERDGVLAHLAVCAECRGVVALALPEVPAALPATEPRSWFTGWMVFLPAAAAVAALTVFIFFVRRQSPAPQQQAQNTPATTSPGPASAAPPQLQSGSPAQLKSAPASPQAAIATRDIPLQPKPRVETENAAIGAAGVIQPAPNRPAANESAVGQNIATEGQSVQSLPTQNAANSFAPSANNGVVSQNQSTDQASVPRSTSHGGAVGGAIQSNNNYQQSEANAQNRQQQNSLQQTASQTVQVQADAPAALATESAELNTVVAGRATTNLTFMRQPVPSKLPLLSSAAQGPVVLAIDTRHSVFVSNDSGQHWKTVQAVWKGRAVMVEATTPDKMLALSATGANVQSLSAMSRGALDAKKAGAVLTGTVTDQSGAVVSGATVTVTDPQTGLARTLSTDASGRYLAAGLDPGNYDMEASAQGFMSNHLSKVAVTASKENLANFSLRVGAATQTVTVEASDVSDELKTAPKSKAPLTARARQTSAPLFEMVTDKGVHWASADGITWQPE